MRPRQHDRFVLIGLCWLYGRSEFPPPYYGTSAWKFCKTMWMMHGWTPYVAIGQQGLIRCTPVLRHAKLGMQSPFLGPAGVGAVDPHTFRRNMGDAYKRNWAGLHDSPRTAPSARATSCTYLRWFARPGKMPAEPYFELPISLSKLRRLMQFRPGSMTCQLSRAAWQGL